MKLLVTYNQMENQQTEFITDMSRCTTNSQKLLFQQRWHWDQATKENRAQAYMNKQEYYPRVGFSFELQWIENIIRAYQKKDDREKKEPEIFLNSWV